jgi:hypothetical protein
VDHAADPAVVDQQAFAGFDAGKDFRQRATDDGRPQ